MASRSGKWAKRLAVFLFITLVASVIYTLVRMTCAPEGERAHYRLMFVQCLLGVAVMLLPGWISKKWSVEIPSVMEEAKCSRSVCMVRVSVRLCMISDRGVSI